MKYKVWYDDENGVVRYFQSENLNIDEIRKVTILIDKYARETEARSILLDLSEGSSATLDKESRKAFKDFAMPELFDKIAIYGANPAMRMISKVIFAVTGTSKTTRFFNTEEDALTWLKGDTTR